MTDSIDRAQRGSEPRRTGADAQDADPPALVKDPSDWVTGDEPMTAAQASYLETLSRQTGEEPPSELTKADASRTIDELREKAGLDTGDR